jgi:hypothetical protein
LTVGELWRGGMLHWSYRYTQEIMARLTWGGGLRACGNFWSGRGRRKLLVWAGTCGKWAAGTSGLGGGGGKSAGRHASALNRAGGGLKDQGAQAGNFAPR